MKDNLGAKLAKGSSPTADKVDSNGQVNEMSHNIGDRQDQLRILEEFEIPQEPRLTETSSASRPHELIVIPRDKRRGLLARFTLIPEVENPKDYSRGTKWTLTAFVALAAAAGPMASAIFMREF